MNSPLKVLILPLFCATLTGASLCVVTKWGEWSECTGTCSYALQVRNRDVLRPPFPEPSTTTGEIRLKQCPELYETRKCIPNECLSGERAEPIAATQRPTSPGNELFRDLPAIRSVTSDTAKSPFESDKIVDFAQKSLKRPSPKKPAERMAEKVVDGGRPSQVPRRVITQAHRPNCTLEMSAQCCRLVREQCPNGESPPGEQLCRPFHYPHCGDNLEKVEKPLVTESSCLQACFSDYEKAILPSLRII